MIHMYYSHTLFHSSFFASILDYFFLPQWFWYNYGLFEHDELGDLDLPEYMLRSAYRYFRRTDKLYAFEKEIIDLMKFLLRQGDTGSDEIRERLQDFVAALTELFKNPEGTRLLGIMEMRFWAEAKLAGLSLKAYYLQQRAKH